jgi:hypothetical protein
MNDRDKELALCLRDKLVQLRGAIEDAQSAGLSVEVPELAHLYLTHGTASGGPDDWWITRRH